MSDFTTTIMNILNKAKYFERDAISYNGISVVKPNAVVFDWENTIVQRKSQYTITYKDLSFEIIDHDIIKLLELLKKNKIYTAIVSNKDKFRLHDEIDKLNFYKYFNKIIGLGDSPEKKPSIECMIRAISDTNIEFGENIWMIGDSESDMEFAKISCATGILIDRENLKSPKKSTKKTNYALKISRFNEIIEILKKFFDQEKDFKEKYNI